MKRSGECLPGTGKGTSEITACRLWQWGQSCYLHPRDLQRCVSPWSCLALPSRIEAVAVRAESLPDGWGKGGREGKGVQMCDVCVPQGHISGPPGSVTLLSPPFSLQLRQMLGLSFHLLLQSSCSYISPGNGAGWVWEQSCTSQTHGVSLGGERVVTPFRGRIRV